MNAQKDASNKNMTSWVFPLKKLLLFKNVFKYYLFAYGSKNEKTNNLKARIFYTTNFNIDNSKSLSWNLGSNIEVFNAELFAIEKAFKIAFEKIIKFTKNIWVFSNSQAAI